MEQTLADDLLDGATEIARYTGFKLRRVFYLCENNRLPAFKIGNRWCARKSEVRAALGGTGSKQRNATRSLLENLREIQSMPVLKNVKCGDRYIVDDIGKAIDELKNLRSTSR